MPVLSEEMQQELLERALESAHVLGRAPLPCGATVLDYCRTCDEFYWVHPASGCSSWHQQKELHYGHRLTIVPYVEER